VKEGLKLGFGRMSWLFRNGSIKYLRTNRR